MFPFVVNNSLNNNNVQKLKPGARALTLEMPRLFFVVPGHDLSHVKNLRTQTLTLCDLTARPFSKQYHGPLMISRPQNMKESRLEISPLTPESFKVHF